MATSFINALAAVGSTRAEIYTVPTGVKAILIGCNLANKTGGVLPVSLILTKGTADSYIVKNLRVGNGENQEVMKGNKLVLASGDVLSAESAIDNAFDVVASILTGVS